VAVITRNFVTGIAQITLVTPEPAGPPLPEPAGEQLAVINEGRSDLDELAGRVGLLGDMTAEALGNLNRVLNAENRAALAGTLANLRELTAGLNQRLERFDRTLEQVGDAAERIGAGTQRLAETAERAGAGVDALVADTRRAVMQAEHAAAEVARAVAALQAQAQAITDRVDQTAASWDDQLSAAVAELRLSVDVAARAFDRLQDPRGAVLGPDKAQLGPGEKLR
jgi:phospholipid/cholesterol/gamma-HCH transport system substrate-binding protein